MASWRQCKILLDGSESMRGEDEERAETLLAAAGKVAGNIYCQDLQVHDTEFPGNYFSLQDYCLNKNY
jgi:hypothetical protein